MMRQSTNPRNLHQFANFHECESCKRNITSANHYCHDCHMIFCDACVVKEKEDIQVCSECGMNLFATDEKTGELFCRQCREEGVDNAKVVSIQREKLVCPKCRSPNTSEIDELKSNLKEKYKNIVIESRNVLDEFSNFTGMLSTVKQKLMKLRLELPVMLHEPGLEQEMLGLIEEGGLIERRIMNRIHNFFLFLRSKKPYFFDGRLWQNQDVAVLETYINQLQSDFMSFTAQVSESFNQPLELLQSLKDRVEFLLTIKEFFIKYMNKDVINLDKAEFPVIHVEDVKLESDDEEHKGHGHVLLTTKYFKFIKSQGYLKKTDALLFSFPVTKLLSTDIIGRIFKRLALQFQGINLKFNMDKEKMQLLAKYFEQLLDFEQLNKLDQDKIQRIKAFDVNSIFKIKAYIEENINALLNPGDTSTPASSGYYASPPATTFSGGMAGTASGTDMEFEQILNLAGDDSQGMQDAQRTKGNSSYHAGGVQAGYATNSQAERYADPYPPSSSQRFFRPVRDQGQGQGQQVLDQAYPQVDPRYQGQTFVPRPVTGVYGTPDMAPQGMGSWGSGMRLDVDVYQQQAMQQQAMQQQAMQHQAMQQQAMQSRLQKAQDVHMLMSQLQAIEQRMVSIKETMRNLEAKFELGKIAASVYFSTHQLFSEKMISLNQEDQELRQQLASMQAAARGQQF